MWSKKTLTKIQNEIHGEFRRWSWDDITNKMIIKSEFIKKNIKIEKRIKSGLKMLKITDKGHSKWQKNLLYGLKN